MRKWFLMLLLLVPIVFVAAYPVPGLTGSDASYMTLYPPGVAGTVGETHTVTARFTGSDGRPIAGAPVYFEATGANSAAGIVYTDSNGQATFSYCGTNAGNDTITASYRGVVATATRSWIKAYGTPRRHTSSVSVSK